MTHPDWKQGQQLEISIDNLTDKGEGVGRYEDRVVFVGDTVTGDRILTRLVRVKRKYAHGKLEELLEASPHRIRPQCIVADKCGGCQWQHVDYQYQLEAKRHLVIQNLERIGEFTQPPVDPVLPSPSPLDYRNKATYPVRISSTGQVQAGYYQKKSHRLINLNQCPVQDQRLNPLLSEIKQDIQKRGWLVYNESRRQGVIRHLSLRIGRRTGQMLLTLIVTQRQLPGLEMQAEAWLQQYPQLVGVCININPHTTNIIFSSETYCVMGRPYLREEFAGLKFLLRPDTFFQVNTEVTEAVLNVILDELNLQGQEVLVDAYCGIGTLTLPLAQRLQQLRSTETASTQPQVIGIEVQAAAVQQAYQNAELNDITNVTFQVGNVQNCLPKLTVKPDIVLLDPPRKGCNRAVIETLLEMQPQRIVYMSCKPATLARDLKILCHSGHYKLTRVQPADFFPQTSHIECVAFLEHQA